MWSLSSTGHKLLAFNPSQVAGGYGFVAVPPTYEQVHSNA